MVSTSAKARKAYYQTLIARTGFTESVREVSESAYQELMLLLQCHPAYKTKVQGTIDLKIRPNALSPQYYELNVIKKVRDKVIVDSVSYNACLQAATHDKFAALKKAMRNHVSPQLLAFRRGMPLVCALCQSENQIEVDHHIPKFRDLFADFVQSWPQDQYLPSSFNKNSFNSVAFQDEDCEFSSQWYAYHKDHAVLRPLCRACNLRTAHSDE